MKTWVIGGTLLTPHQVLPDHTLIIKDGKFADILAGVPQPATGDRVVDATGFLLTPGFLDIHTHGALGGDTMDASCDTLHKMAHFFVKHGVTAYLPTTWSAHPRRILQAIENVASCSQPEDGAHHLGVHVEGPYLNIDHRGAQRPEVIRTPDAEEYTTWLESGVLCLVTLAPEVEGALDFVERGVSQGVEFAIGHSGATFEQVAAAADRGVRQATHLYNGMLGLHHRRPGTVGGCLLDDRIYTQIIVDGVHVHPAMVRLAICAKTPARTILITDAICGTGLPDGDYEFDGQVMYVRGGVSRTPAGGLSGSTLTMDQALRNAIQFTGLPLNEVLPMATSVPAEAMGWQGKKGSLARGADADLVFLDEALNVLKTFVAGRVVFEAEGAGAT